MTEAQEWVLIAVFAASVVGVWVMHWSLNRALDRAMSGVHSETQPVRGAMGAGYAPSSTTFPVTSDGFNRLEATMDKLHEDIQALIRRYDERAN